MAAGAVVETMVEEVASNLEEVAEVTRQVNAQAVGYFLGGIGVGIALGFYFGYRFNREKIKAEAFKQSEEEVAAIREVYQQKTVAATPKPSVEQIVEEKGYSVLGEQGRSLPAPVPIMVPVPVPVRVPPSMATHLQGWDYTTEVAARTGDKPYVIHQNEFMDKETDYNQTTYTYYAGDDVLVDTDDRPLPHADIIVGQDNLKFGHGTDDENVVFVRNDTIQLEMEICRSPGRYDEEVLGLNSDEAS